MSREQDIRRHYETRLSADRENFDILNWASAESQRIRFAVLAENVDLRGKMLLDVGCGLGDLYAFCRERGIEPDYTGVDLSEKMVRAARRQNPAATFLCMDVFTDATFGPEQFDVVFCSGAFNLNLGNNRRFLLTALPRLVDLAREYAVFNLLHERTRCREDGYFYCNPEEVLKMLRNLPCESRLLDNYLQNDFTVICRKLRAVNG